MPRAEGLFRRAILQSGAAQHVSSAETATRIGRYLAEKLGVPPSREAIAAIPVERLLTGQAELEADLSGHPDRWGPEMVASRMPWEPVIDGEVVPGPPIERIAAGASAQVDVLVGTNTDDWKLLLVITGAIGQVTDEDLTRPVGVGGFPSLAAYGLPVEKALTAYRARYPDARPGDLLAAVQTDWWIRIPAIRLADAHANTTSATYMYEFGWQAPGIGAVHGIEIPFVFDTLNRDARLFGPMLGKTHRRSWPTPCTQPGSPSRPTVTPGGRSTTSAAGPPCASTQPHR